MAHSLFGYEIATDFPLARGRNGPSVRGRLEVRATRADPLERQGELVSWMDRDGAQFALASCGKTLLAWCSETGSFLIDGPGGVIEAQPSGSADAWEHRLGSTIMPLLLAERGDLALHASAVVADGEAVLFCGPSGRGKSVIAAALALRGHPVLSDDGVVLSDLTTRPRAWPGQTGNRVPPDVVRVLDGGIEPSGGDHGGKTVHVLGPADDGSLAAVDVTAVVLLRPRGGAGSQVERLDPVSAVPALMPHIAHGGRSRLARTLRLAARLAECAPVFRAQLPDDLTAAAQVSASILNQVTDRSGRAA
jgi:hypothetical protein